MNKFITILITIYFSLVFKRSIFDFRVYGGIKIIDPTKFSFGSGLRVNYTCYINASGGVQLGKNVTLSSGSKIISSSIDMDKFKSNHRTGDYHEVKRVILGDNIWLGANSIILPGVSLSGRNVVVGASAIVTKSFHESNIILAGNPAKIVKNI